jgi:hypothetical protein
MARVSPAQAMNRCRIARLARGKVDALRYAIYN